MMRRTGIWIVALTLVTLYSVVRGALPVQAQDANSAKITSPKDGDPLFGLVTIQGTASNGNMQRYVLEFDLQDTGSEQWFPIAGPITQQVSAGVLGQWNTTAVPDGRYQIRLRVVLRDGSVISDVVQNLHVSNKQPTPLPTSLPPASAAPPTGSPTPGPSVTPIIQQPPTGTVRPAVVPTVLATLAPVAVSGSGQALPPLASLDTFQTAFCSGAYIAFGLFLLIGIYSVIRSRLRPSIRRMINQLRDDRD